MRTLCCVYVHLLQGQHTHEAYTGDRTKEAFEQFADSLVPSAGQPQLKHAQLKAAPKASGCNVAGAQARDTSVVGASKFGDRVQHIWGSGKLRFWAVAVCQGYGQQQKRQPVAEQGQA